MSRIAKQPISLPSGVSVSAAGGELVVKGPRGELSRSLHPAVAVSVDGTGVRVAPRTENREARALSGTFAAHLKNMIAGVTVGFAKKLLLEGVGYRAEVSGGDLVLAVGFSHPVRVAIPPGLSVAAEKGVITIAGNDKERVGEFAASVRALKKPEPYKGKGIRYEGEVIRRKQGKKAVA